MLLVPILSAISLIREWSFPLLLLLPLSAKAKLILAKFWLQIIIENNNIVKETRTLVLYVGEKSLLMMISFPEHLTLEQHCFLLL
jgi:hypothetical protein